jgi:intracellular sulfur oxidation DsrE/DsrF family protein
MKIKRISQVAVLALLTLLMVTTGFAKQENPHKLVIQVSTDDVITQKMALNNAVNLQKLYGLDNMIIEIVAYGPGLKLLTTQSEVASRVKSLVMQNITFSACRNTMESVKKKTGKLPTLLNGVETVNSGVAQIMKLQEQGYAYIRP